MKAVVAKNDGVAQTKLVFFVEGCGERRIQPFRFKKLAEAADQHLVFIDLAVLHALPVALIDGGIAVDLVFRTFAEAKFRKQAADRSALRCVKVQQRAVYIPQDGRDHDHSSVSPLTGRDERRSGPMTS